jgi:CRISPR/Cas system-associated exonuclease Cas4 (RecB family)
MMLVQSESRPVIGILYYIKSKTFLEVRLRESDRTEIMNRRNEIACFLSNA